MLYLGRILNFTFIYRPKMTFESNENLVNSGGILDTIMESEQAAALSDFSPELIVLELLTALKEREREILGLRYGLTEGNKHTLDAIGKRLSLTRERVRQVEKESVNKLKKQKFSDDHKKAMDIVEKVVYDHGGVFAERALVGHLLLGEKSEKQTNSLLFLLDLLEGLHKLKESENYHPSWHIKDFEIKKLDDFHKEINILLEKTGSPVELAVLREKFKETEVYKSDPDYFSEAVIENLLKIVRKIQANPFGGYGLSHWRDIRPKDVGDKAYLVLKYYGKPEHYTKITERINKHKFDNRTAYKETVHNELIMDPRFVLVGRGIYALSEWGYSKGVVSDVIKAVLQEAKEPMERSRIVDEVMKRRMVKRNTVLVGLANKRLFKKQGKNKYALV